MPDVNGRKAGLGLDLGLDLDPHLRAEATPSLVTLTNQGEVLHLNQRQLDKCQGNFCPKFVSDTNLITVKRREPDVRFGKPDIIMSGFQTSGFRTSEG